MNLSLTNHNITALPHNDDQTIIDTSTTKNKEPEEHKKDTDSDNDDEEGPSPEEIAKQKQEIYEMKGMIGQKRRSGAAVKNKINDAKENDDQSADTKNQEAARNKSDASNRKVKKTK